MKIFIRLIFTISIILLFSNCEKQKEDDFYITVSGFTIDNIRYEVNNEGYIICRKHIYEGQLVEKTEYSYDKNHTDFISRIIYNDYANNYKVISDINNSYNMDNKIIQSTIVTDEGKKIWDFYYDDYERLIKQEYNYNNKYGHDYSCILYYYLESGKLYSKIDSFYSYSLDNSIIVEFNYTYSDNNQLKKIVQKHKSTVQDSTYFYYDKDGNISYIFNATSTDYIFYDKLGRFTEYYTDHTGSNPNALFKYDSDFDMKPFLFSPSLYEYYLLKIPACSNLFNFISPETYK